MKLEEVDQAEILTIGPEQVHNFRVGEMIVIDRYGRRITGLRLRMYFLGQRLRTLTRWWRPRNVVSAIDQDAGIVTISTERWSWLRWRWERV